MGIEWTNDMSVGVEEIDNQHKHFVGIMNELHKAAQRKERKDILGAIIGELDAFAEYHFATEEKYFTIFNYKDKREHIKKHKEIKKQIKKFIVKQKSEDSSIAIELVYFLEDWMNDHLKDQDSKYVDCFKEHGLK